MVQEPSGQRWIACGEASPKGRCQATNRQAFTCQQKKPKKVMGLIDFLKPQSSQQKRQADLIRSVESAMPAMFPGGKADIEHWSRRVYDAVDGRLTLQECQFIFGAI